MKVKKIKFGSSIITFCDATGKPILYKVAK